MQLPLPTPCQKRRPALPVGRRCHLPQPSARLSAVVLVCRRVAVFHSKNVCVIPINMSFSTHVFHVHHHASSNQFVFVILICCESVDLDC